MGDDVVHIEKLENGWELEICDPDVQAKNRDPKYKGPWQDPWKGYAFSDIDAMLAFLKEKLPELHPEDEDETYAQAFTAASDSD